MARNFKVKIGDLLVRFGKILKVSQIKEGSVELRPFFNTKSSNGLTYSIQDTSLDSGSVRHLVSKEKLGVILAKILKATTTTLEINVTESKVSLSTHELTDSLRIIKDLWLEKQNHAGFLPGGRLSLYQQALIQASEEIAAVKGILPEQAKLLVLTTLKQGFKPVSENDV